MSCGWARERPCSSRPKTSLFFGPRVFRKDYGADKYGVRQKRRKPQGSPLRVPGKRMAARGVPSGRERCLVSVSMRRSLTE